MNQMSRSTGGARCFFNPVQLFCGSIECVPARVCEADHLLASKIYGGGPTVSFVFDKRIAEAVSREVEEAAYRTGMARRERTSAEVTL